MDLSWEYFSDVKYIYTFANYYEVSRGASWLSARLFRR